MEIQDYLNKVAYIGKSNIQDDNEDIYYSKYDDSYITRVGMEENVKFLADNEITEELTHGVGFSPKQNKWYGWSHRAVYGFTVGSTCKKGDCHYVPSSYHDQIEDAIRFWNDDGVEDVKCNGVFPDDNGEEYALISWKYCFDKTKIPNEKLHGTISSVRHYLRPLGRGEWVAESMEDAKQMAIDFNEGVS